MLTNSCISHPFLHWFASSVIIWQQVTRIIVPYSSSPFYTWFYQGLQCTVPHLPMAQAAGLFNLLFYRDVYFLPLIAEGAYSSSLEDIIHFFDFWRKMRWMPLRVSMQVFFIVFSTHTPLTSSLCVFLLLLLLLWLVIFFFSEVVTFLTLLKVFSKFWTPFEPACSYLLHTLFLWLLAVWSEYFYFTASAFQLPVPLLKLPGVPTSCLPPCIFSLS